MLIRVYFPLPLPSPLDGALLRPPLDSPSVLDGLLLG